MPFESTISKNIVTSRGYDSTQGLLVSGLVNPSTLFASGEKGYWMDASDITTMWQDSAGTTPVTTLGDPVGKWTDKSGNGVVFTQATSGNRPTWNQDSSGYYYLNFDGTNDCLASTATLNHTSTDKLTVWVAMDKQFSSGSRLAVSAGYGSAGGWAIFSQVGGGSADGYIAAAGTGTGGSGYQNIDGVGSGKVTAGALYDISAGTFNGRIIPRINSRYCTYSNGSTGFATGNFGNITHRIGSDSTPGSFFRGKIYQVVVRLATTTGDLLLGIDNYINSKIGVW